MNLCDLNSRHNLYNIQVKFEVSNPTGEEEESVFEPSYQ